jgi:hypothetical protein
MKPRLLFWSLSLVIALLAVACASTPPTETPSTASDPAAVPTAATEAAAAQTEAPALTEAPAVVPAVVVTPRGDALEATDPATVSLASGGLQLVEFFRFT